MEIVKGYIEQYLKDFSPYKNGTWCYEDGIILKGCEYLYEVFGDKMYIDFIDDYLKKAIDESGTPNNYEKEKYNIDNINAGKVLFGAYSRTGKKSYKKAMDLLFEQLKEHPRTTEGNYWHKSIYPNQIWLDGIYMGQPYYLEYAIRFLGKKEKEEVIKDVLGQFEIVEKRLKDPKTGLYYHAFDEARKLPWADKKTGCSPHVWSRAIGWYMMALVDVIERLQALKISVEALKNQLQNISRALIPYRREGMWMQVLDCPEAKGNYTETSGTMMIAYAFLKGKQLGCLDPSYEKLGIETFEATIEEKMYFNENKIHLSGICQVAGLDASRRDGSLDYYLSEPVVDDEAKGVAPMMMSYARYCKSEVSAKL